MAIALGAAPAVGAPTARSETLIGMPLPIRVLPIRVEFRCAPGRRRSRHAGSRLAG
jgi:hypothetical protein